MEPLSYIFSGVEINESGKNTADSKSVEKATVGTEIAVPPAAKARQTDQQKSKSHTSKAVGNKPKRGTAPKVGPPKKRGKAQEKGKPRPIIQKREPLLGRINPRNEGMKARRLTPML